jgi:hypothetical protein
MRGSPSLVSTVLVLGAVAGAAGALADEPRDEVVFVRGS